MHGVTPFELTVALALVILGLELVAHHVSSPRPVVLAAGGVLLGLVWDLVPALPRFTVEPQLVLDLVLPPLLAAAAFRVPAGAFRASLRPISLLAVGLVLVTMVLVAFAAHAIVPGITWAAALVLGATVAPPDSVAATSVAGRIGLSNRLTTILEGEGLVNDATALVAYQLAVEAAVLGTFSWAHAAASLLRSVPTGVAAGLAAGWATALVRRRVDDTLLESAISLLAPYVAYALAERLGGSGVLAVVAFGMFVRRRATEIGSPPTRLVNRAVWQVTDFVTGGLVFVLVGLELGRVAASGVSLDTVRRAAIVVAVAVGARLAWMYLVPHLERVVRRVDPDDAPSLRELTVLGWAGMRGVVSLALALAIPTLTAAGRPFPARLEIVAISLAVVLATLLGQGLTLAPLIRWLGVAEPGATEREEQDARAAAIRAALDRLDALVKEGRLEASERELLGHQLERRLGVAQDTGPPTSSGRVAVLLEGLEAQRRVLRERWDDGKLSEGTATRLEAELDLAEMYVRGTTGQLLGG